LQKAFPPHHEAMKRKTLLLLFTVLLAPIAARAQTATPPPIKSGIEDDPQFKRLDPNSQKLVKQIVDNVENAAAAERAGQQPTTTVSPTAPKTEAKASTAVKAPGGCPADAPKKSRFHVPKAFQNAINRGKLGDLTGINTDPNAKKDAPKDSAGKPCPPSPAPATPTGK
jgi:hypothetical protein